MRALSSSGVQPSCATRSGSTPIQRRIRSLTPESRKMNGANSRRKKRSGADTRRATPSARSIAYIFGTSSPATMWALVMIR